MVPYDNDTQSKIKHFGKIEFLEKGFKNASLRNIVKNAGVTTGAFYGYYKDKEALFNDLVSIPADKLKKSFLSAQIDFDSIPNELKKNNMHNYSYNKLYYFIDYIFENFEAFKLIICCSQGTKYNNYIDELVEIESLYTEKFLNSVKQTGYPIKNVSPDITHILGNAYFSAIFEIVIHDMTKETADKYIETINEFFYSGWYKIMGI